MVDGKLIETDLHKAAAGIPDTIWMFRTRVAETMALLYGVTVEANEPIDDEKVAAMWPLFDAVEQIRQEWLAYATPKLVGVDR